MGIKNPLKSLLFSRPEARHWKLRTKMLLLAAIVFAGFALSTVLATLTLNQVKVGGALYSQIKNDKNSLERIALLLLNLNKVNAEVYLLVAETDPDRMKASIEKLGLLEGEITEKFAAVSRTLDSDEKRVAVQDAEATWKEFSATLAGEVMSAVQRNDRVKARELALGVQAMRFERFTEQVGAIVDTTNLEIEELEAASSRTISRKILLTAAFSGGLCILILVSSLIVTNSVTQPIRQGVDFARSVAAGNLTETLAVRRGDEVGELVGALNGMVGSLNGMVSKVDHSTAELSQISANLTEAASRVVKATQLQASGVSETSSAVSEISASLKQVALWVDTLARSATESSSSILEMASSVEEVAQNMDNLSQSVGEVSSSITQMSSSIRQVSDGVETLMTASSTTASSMTEMDSSIKQIQQHASDTAGISDTVRLDAERAGRRWRRPSPGSMK